MRVFLDCEYLWRGDLLSMGLIAEDGREWYEALEPPDDINDFPWVVMNVMNVMDREPVHPTVFRHSLHAFVLSIPEPEVIADWPLDLMHFFSMMAGEDQGSALIFHIRAQLVRKGKIVPETPHNALSDARALRELHLATG